MAGPVPEDRANHSNRSGFKYTGAAFFSHNQTTGHISPSWQGELHGEWMGENDPAHEMAANFGATHHEDGTMSLPNHMKLYSPHPDMPGQYIEKHVPLGSQDRNDMRIRQYYKDRAKEKQQ